MNIVHLKVAGSSLVSFGRDSNLFVLKDFIIFPGLVVGTRVSTSLAKCAMFWEMAELSLFLIFKDSRA